MGHSEDILLLPRTPPQRPPKTPKDPQRPPKTPKDPQRPPKICNTERKTLLPALITATKHPCNDTVLYYILSYL